jgi:signal transduction histidine kinase
MRNQLFNRPRLQLALVYSGVMGGILLSMGVLTHVVIQRTFDRIINRELELLPYTFNTKLNPLLTQPGRLPPSTNTVMPELCLVNQPCTPPNPNDAFYQIIQQDYHIQFLDLRGQPIAALAEPPDPLFANPTLVESQTQQNKQGDRYHLHLMPLKTPQGELWGYLQVGRSVQQLDRYMRNLHLLVLIGIPTAMLSIGWASWFLAGLAIAPIYQSYERMQQFTTDVTHELKTPIATSQAVIETALSIPQNDLQTNTLRSLQRQTERLNQLVQDLLLLLKLDQTPGQFESVCLNDIILDIEEELAPLTIAANIDFHSQININYSLTIPGNPNQLYRLLSNLITNAIQATPANGQIIIKLDETSQQAIIQITDTGIGIPPESLPNLFHRFYRIHTDRSRQSGGSGLGLAIVKAIALAHNGAIAVTSVPNQGTTFTVSLPLGLGRSHPIAHPMHRLNQILRHPRRPQL